MIPWHELLAFSGIMAVGQFSPGPDMILVTRVALRDGRSNGIATGLGIATSLIVHVTIAVAGVSLVIQQHPVLQMAFRLTAATYLFWLAWRLFTEALRGSPASSPAGLVPGSPVRALGLGLTHIPPPLITSFRRGLWCNLLNPKAAIFLAAVTGPFLAGQHFGWWPALLAMVTVVQGGLLWSCWAVALQWAPLRRAYTRATVPLEMLFAAALVLLATIFLFGRI